MNVDLHLRVAGALQIALAGIHVFFPRWFQWKEELPRLSLLNRQVFIVHTFFIGVILTMMGGLSLFATQTLTEPSPLSKLVLAGFALFWGIRLLFQWFVYDARLWRGDRLKTLAHAGATLLWAYLTAVYAGVLLMRA